MTAYMGGPPISEASLARNLSKECEVVVLVERTRADATFIDRFGLRNIRYYDRIDPLKAFLNPGHWLNKFISASDVFHLNGHWKWENYFLSMLCRRHATPYVFHPRGMLLLEHRRVFLKKVFNFLIGNSIAKHASAVVALSNFETKQFEPYPISKAAISVIPNGIPEVPEKYVYIGQEPKSYFLYIGRIESRKNLVFLVEAFAEYSRRAGSEKLLLVGPVERGYDEEIRTKINSLNLEEKIEICQPAYGLEKWAYIKNARAVVYPAFGESFGRVPFEAIKCEVPCVLPNESGGAEYLERFLPDCIYEQQNSKSLAIALLNSTKVDPAQITKAKKWTEDNLDWNTITTNMLTIYRTIRENHLEKRYSLTLEPKS